MGSFNEAEYIIKDPPLDGISSVKFSSLSENILVSSWDKTVRLYDPIGNELKVKTEARGAVLDVSFLDDTKGFFGGLSSTVNISAVKCIEYLKGTEHDALFTGSWDKTVKIWDHRASQFLTKTLHTPGKVFTMDVKGSTLIVGCSGRLVDIYDLRNLSTPQQTRESSLKYQTRCVTLMPNLTGYVLSSIEGRVAVEYLDSNPETQSKKYAFKCHRQGDLIHPVNTISFHPTYGTFATGGCDGTVNIWDGANKKRLVNYTGYPSSISCVSFNRDGRYLVIASSYTFEQGDIEHAPDTLYMREVNTNDVKPKPRK